jgi:hypothetical protein
MPGEQERAERNAKAAEEANATLQKQNGPRRTSRIRALEVEKKKLS